ncbi:MAG: hypothetical protein ACJAXY_000500 [Nonlabens sp.]|jgi:hypothetical protein
MNMPKYICTIKLQTNKIITMKMRSESLRTSIIAMVITSLLNIIVSVGSQPNADQSKTNMLINRWHLNAYVVDGESHSPDKKEKGDYILFKEDMTFTSKSEGKEEEKGTFLLNTSGGYVLMIDKKGEEIKAYIHSISENSLVLLYDIDEIRDVEVHYNRPI